MSCRPGFPPSPLARRTAAALLLAWIGLAPQAQATPAAPPPPDDCALAWQLTPQLDAQPRRLAVVMRFDAAGRSQTALRLPGGWAGVTQEAADGAGPALQPVPGAPMLRSVTHPPHGRVEVRWQLTPTADGSAGSGVQLTPQWFALAGQGVLPMPDGLDERQPPAACISLGGLPADSRWASSHGLAEGASALLRVAPGPESLRLRVQQSLYAGGALLWQTGHADGQALQAVMPADAPWRFGIDALAQAGTQALGAQRRFWGDNAPAPALLLLLLPAAQGSGSAAWHRALALQAPPDLPVPGARLDTLLTSALVRSWMGERFGPLAHPGRGDQARRAWFTEGWTDYYTHRQLLRDGRWTVQDYASAINQKLQLDATLPAPASERPGPGSPLGKASVQGEWLALQWQRALRAAGQPGLDAVMRRLLVPPAQARQEGPLSAPLATHRLLAALRHTLGDVPLRDVTRHIDKGAPFEMGPDALGPCFAGQRQPVGTWRLGFDAASLGTRVARGVEPGGPAEAAGLRDGMKLLGHALVPADATQPVRLQVQADDGSTQELRYLPAGEPVRDLLRFAPVPQALDKPACQAWLGQGPEIPAAAGGSGGQPGAQVTKGVKGAKGVKGGKPAGVGSAKGPQHAKGAKAAKGARSTKSARTGKSGQATTAKPRAGKAAAGTATRRSGTRR